MTCVCADLVDKKLAPRNTRLSYMFGIMPLGKHQARALVAVQITTVKIDEKKRGKPVAVAAQFCPFCGVALAADRNKQSATGIARAHNQEAFAALARVPVERRAPSTNFPLWRDLY
jgi:hypothetical protein